MPPFVCADGTKLPVTLRLSARAHHRRLTLEHTGTLIVTIPAGKGHKRQAEKDAVPAAVTAFLEQNRPWIERAAARTRPQREAYEHSAAAGLPTHIDFPALREAWLVEYAPTQAQSISARRNGLRRIEDDGRRTYALKLSGAVCDEALCRRALVRFVTQRAKEALPPLAWEDCRAVGAAPRDIMVNNRKSAWGVCTHDGVIKLDRKAVFLPPDLVHQIVLHETAHLTHMNHSQQFYHTLFSLEGSSKEAEKAVKKAIQFVPAWMLDPR
jgi:predicted metal-dependent hydrolase